MRTREELPGRSPIALGQARLTLELFADGLPEKKLQLIGMSILLILLSPRPGCYILTPLRDRRPRRSTPSQERPLLPTSVCPEGDHAGSTPAMRTMPTQLRHMRP